MDSWTVGMVVLSLVGLVVGFAISLHDALKQSDRVTFIIDGEILQVRRRHAKADIQRVLSRLIPRHARHSSTSADQMPEVWH